jgi:hypothetical protein
VLEACLGLEKIELALDAFALLRKHGFQPSPQSYDALVALAEVWSLPFLVRNRASHFSVMFPAFSFSCFSLVAVQKKTGTIPSLPLEQTKINS